MNITKNNCASDSSTPSVEKEQPGTRKSNSTTRTSYPTIPPGRRPLWAGGRNPKSLRGVGPYGPEAEIRNRRTRTTQRESWWCIDFDTIDYGEAWKLQTDIVSARNNEVIDTDVILILEHRPVFTLGRRGGEENLLVSESFLEKSGIAVTQVERGGNITYHGPGQLVVYPIVDLEAAKISVVDFVEALENVMLQTINVWGINAERNPVNRGIWVGDKKMGSIGIALRKGISFHGLALNVNLDLTPFSWIQPCGLQGVRMTSMKQELSGQVSMPDVRKVLREKFESVFGVQIVASSIATLRDTLAIRV